MNEQILLIGKLAYRLQFTVTIDFTDLLRKDVAPYSIDATELHRSFDGMVSNVAYGLVRLNSTPTVFSQVGRDFDWHYRPHLEKLGVKIKVFIDSNKETPLKIIIGDSKDRVLTIHQENSYRYIADKDLLNLIPVEDIQGFKAVFIATGIAEADAKFISDLYEITKSIPLIYSPDNNVQSLTNWRISQIIEKITILICTESELEIIEQKMNTSREEILTNSNRLRYIISMINRSKIVVYSDQFKMKVSEAPAEEVISVNEWQDAFRAGVIYGVSLKKPIAEVVQLSSSLASYAVECRENHQYSPSLEEVVLRAFEVKTIQKDY